MKRFAVWQLIGLIIDSELFKTHRSRESLLAPFLHAVRIMVKINVILFSFVNLIGFFCQFSAADLTNSVTSKDICEILLNSTKSGAGNALFNLGATQVQRIGAVLDGLSEEQQTRLFRSLGSQNLRSLALDIRLGNTNGIGQIIKKQPDLGVMLTDFIQFGDIFPGIFSSRNAIKMVRMVVDLVRKQEIASKLNNIDILESQTEAPRLRRTLDETIMNLIEQAQMEYEGAKFGRSSIENFFYRLKRFFLPTYGRVVDLIDFAEDLQRQLYRLRAVDSLIIELGLGEAHSLNLTDEEVNKLLEYVMNSPSEIKEIEDLAKKVFGPSFSIGKPVEIGSFNIHAAAATLYSINTARIRDRFDKLNVLSLDELDAILDKARVRIGKKARDIDEYKTLEIQIRTEAAYRQIFRKKESYFSFTAQDADESYTVERKHTRQVEVGKDEDENPIYKDEDYWTKDSVTPSFEEILSDSYDDEGDRTVWGLETIRQETKEMRDREVPTRQFVSKTDRFITDLVENWTESLLKGNTDLKKTTTDLLLDVEKEIRRQKQYAALSETDIHRQYANDRITNFRGRNKAMLERLIQQKAALEMLSEALRRQMPGLFPFYDVFDYSKWLMTLRWNRNFAWTVQAGMAATSATAIGVGMSPDAQRFLIQQGIDFPRWMDQALSLLQHYRR